VSVSFAATVTGPRAAALEVTSDAVSSPNVPLSGTGTAPAVRLSASSVNFGNQPVGTTSAMQTFVLSNTGTGPLNITDITVIGWPKDFRGRHRHELNAHKVASKALIDGGVTVQARASSSGIAHPSRSSRVDFAQTNTCGTALAPGGSCNIAVSFTPSRKGRRRATLTLSDTGAGSPHRVYLSGFGR
jgi:hypothetical protein